MGWKFVNQKKAVWESKDALEKFVKNKDEKYWEEVEKKRAHMNQEYLVARSVVVINRRIAGPNGEYFWPITKQDIVNQLWSHHKVALKPEQLEMCQGARNGVWRKPGLYQIGVRVGERQVLLRMYATKSSKSWDGYTHEYVLVGCFVFFYI